MTGFVCGFIKIFTECLLANYHLSQSSLFSLVLCLCKLRKQDREEQRVSVQIGKPLGSGMCSCRRLTRSRLAVGPPSRSACPSPGPERRATTLCTQRPERERTRMSVPALLQGWREGNFRRAKRGSLALILALWVWICGRTPPTSRLTVSLLLGKSRGRLCSGLSEERGTRGLRTCKTRQFSRGHERRAGTGDAEGLCVHGGTWHS